MTARLDSTGSDGREAALSRVAPGDYPLAIFHLESVRPGLDDSALLRMDAIPKEDHLSVPFDTPRVNHGHRRTAAVVKRIKRVFRALGIARDFEKTVDSRLAALRGLDQEVQNRAQAVSTSLGGDVAVWEAREAIVEAMEQLERRAADTIDGLEERVGDVQARAHIAGQTITRLHDVSSPTLPVIQERTKDAEEQSKSLERLITEAVRMATSLTALEARLPAVGQCDQELARIELAVPQIARQLEDLNASAELQRLALAAHQQLVRQTLDESQQTAVVVSELEGRILDLSGSHQQLDRLEDCVAQLEQRTAAKLLELQGQAERYQQEHVERTTAIVSRLEARHASGQQLLHRVEQQMGEFEQRTRSAATELKHVTDVRAALELEVVQLQNQLRKTTEAAVSEVTKLTTAADETTKRLGAVRQEAERYQRGEAQRAAAVLAGLETRLAEIGWTHRELAVAERHVEQLEQRAAAAAGEVRHATQAKDQLQRDIAKCQQQIERLVTVAHVGAERLNGLGRHAEDQAADRASRPSIHDLLNTLRFRRPGPNTWLVFSTARLIFGGAAFALSAVIVILVGIVWRISPVENQRPERPRPGLVLASPALTLAPALALAPPMQLRADISHDRPEATQPAPAVPARPVPLVVASATPVATRRVPAAGAREVTARKGAKTIQYVGTLLIESDPAGATAFVNHESVGETPVRLKDLRAGSYVVRLEYEGYQRWSTAATVSAVRQERVKAKLEFERSR